MSILSGIGPSPWGQMRREQAQRNVNAGKPTPVTKADRKHFIEDMEDDIAKLAQQDAAEGVYFGDTAVQLHLEYVHEVSPDRAAIKAQAENLLSMWQVSPSIDFFGQMNSWLSSFFGVPYRMEGSLDTNGGNTMQFYNENGEQILSYGPNQGQWAEPWTKAESRRSGEFTAVYYAAYREARTALRENAPSEEGVAEAPLLDTQA